MEFKKPVTRSFERQTKPVTDNPVKPLSAKDHILQAQPAKRHFFHLKISKNSLLKMMAAFFVIACACITIYLYVAWRQSIPPPLPQDAISSLPFEAYYPLRMPTGYRYKPGSVTSQNGLLFYKFTNGKKVITVTQQAAPAMPVEFKKLEGGFTDITVSAGKAAIGTSVGNPSVIIITDTTLISVNSNKGVTKKDVTYIAQKINPVNLQPAP